MAEYTYDGDGRKQRVVYTTSKTDLLVPMGSIVPPQGTNISTTLERDYCGNMIYENGKLKKILIEGGYINTAGPKMYYCYYMKDHLGSNRICSREDSLTVQKDSYYPFGVLQLDRRTTRLQSYKYNGKELDGMHGLDWHDYGARHYDATTGRWMCIDPMAGKYYDVSPYAYCKNNPVKYVDPDGRKIVIAGDSKQKMEMLAILQKLSNDNLFINKKTGGVSVGNMRWDNRNKSLPKGTSLIRELIENDYTVTIFTSANNEAKVHDIYWRDAFNGKGTDVELLFDPNHKGSFVTKEQDGTITEKDSPNFIKLGHELVHGYRSMMGIARDPNTQTEYQYKDINGVVQTASKRTEELETVGIKGNSKYTENDLRKEHDYEERIKY